MTPSLREEHVPHLVRAVAAAALLAAGFGWQWAAALCAWSILALLDPREYLDGVSAIQYIAVPSSYVHGVMVLGRGVDSRHIGDLLGTRLQAHPRFRQRVAWSRWWWPHWVTVTNYRASDHVERRPERCTHAGLEAFLSVSCASLLPQDRPPYRFYVFPNYEDETGVPGAAIVFKYHHSMADGVTMLRALFQATDEDARANAAASRKPAAGAARRGPPRAAACAMAAAGAEAVGKMVLMRDDAWSVLKEPRFLVAGMPLCTRFHQLGTTVAEVKAAAHALGATVNDVLVAAMTAALRRLSERKSRPLDAAKAVLWVSLHPLSTLFKSFREVPLVWGNRGLGAIYLPLPLAAAASSAGRATVRAVQRATGPLVHSPEPVLAHCLIALFGHLHPAVSVPLWNALAYKSSVSFSNLPGPQFPCTLLGHPLRQLIFFVPPTGTLGVFSTVFSYNDRISVGMCSGVGERTAQDTHTLVHAAFEEELRAVMRAGAAGPEQ